MAPTVEELQAELDKRDAQIRGLSTKLQSHERITKELGDAVERDAYGNPVGIRRELDRLPGAGMIGHPFASVLENPGAADTWLKEQAMALFAQQGFVTNAQMKTLLQEAQSHAYQMARGDAMLWRNYDRLVSTEKLGKDGKPTKLYADLTKYDSPYAKTVARILQEKRWGEPMHDKAADFATDWRYSDMKSLEWASDLARMELENAAVATAASTTAATTAQAADALTGSTGAGGGAGAAAKPDFAAMKSTEEVLAALDNALPAGRT